MSCPPLVEGLFDLPNGSQSLDIAALAHHYGADVYRAAYRVLGDRSLAEDVQQEVFVRLLETKILDVESWAAYLCTAATRAAIDVLRSRQRWWKVLPLWSASVPRTVSSAEQESESDERARRLRAALSMLSKREAQCFSLRYLQQLDIGDVAKALAISENTVSVTLHRARRRLEVQLGEATAESSS